MSDQYPWDVQQNLLTIEHWKARAEKAEADLKIERRLSSKREKARQRLGLFVRRCGLSWLYNLTMKGGE